MPDAPRVDFRDELAALVAMLERCGPNVAEADRATDDEWDAALERARAALKGSRLAGS